MPGIWPIWNQEKKCGESMIANVILFKILFSLCAKFCLVMNSLYIALWLEIDLSFCYHNQLSDESSVYGGNLHNVYTTFMYCNEETYVLYEF